MFMIGYPLAWFLMFELCLLVVYTQRVPIYIGVHDLLVLPPYLLQW